MPPRNRSREAARRTAPGTTPSAPVYLAREDVPKYLRQIPGRLLKTEAPGRLADLEAWLTEKGLPRPTLLAIASERHYREETHARRDGVSERNARSLEAKIRSLGAA